MVRFEFVALSWVFLGVTGCGNESFPLPDESDIPVGYFSSGPNLNSPRFEHASVVLPDGRVLVTGGADPQSMPWKAIEEVEIFNPLTNQWSPGPSLILPRFAHQAVGLDDDNVAIIGGQNNASPPGPFTCKGNTQFPTTPYICNTETFDPLQGWSTNAGMDMNYPRIHFDATAVKQGSKVVVAGGIAQEFPKKYELFDAYTRTWDDISAPQNGIRASHVGAALPDEDILLIGGVATSTDGMQNPLREVDRFDVDTKSWTTAGSLNVPRHQHTATSLGDGRVLIAGGNEYGSGSALSSTEIYNEKTNTWSFGPAMLEKRGSHTAALLLGNRRVLVVGGYGEVNGTPSLLESAEILDLETMTWSKIETPMARRWLSTMHVLPTDGRVLILGGATVSVEIVDDKEKTIITPLATTALFTPPCASHFECAPGYRCGVDRVCIIDNL